MFFRRLGAPTVSRVSRGPGDILGWPGAGNGAKREGDIYSTYAMLPLLCTTWAFSAPMWVMICHTSDAVRAGCTPSSNRLRPIRTREYYDMYIYTHPSSVSRPVAPRSYGGGRRAVALFTPSSFNIVLHCWTISSE